MKLSRGAVGRVVVLAAIAAAPILTMTSRESRADDVVYVDCGWSPYREAWACALPGTFREGRFVAPPDFRHDSASEASRQQTWTEAKDEPGARLRGRTGVFFPKDGGWWFVPGRAWSPGDPVFLPQNKAAGH